jgi:hypothetical protein
MINDPITPPPELVQQWYREADDQLAPYYVYIAARAAQWGSDQELEACCEVLARELICDGKHVATDLRMIRRPKPPSLKDQALAILDDCSDRLDGAHENIIRCALEGIN